MASTQKEHYFMEGRKGKYGRRGPGILVVEGKYKFRLNQTNKNKTIYKMYCVQQGNPEFGCRAKTTVGKREDGSFFLFSCDTEHNHLVSEAAIKAEEYKQRMGELVRKDPAAPVGEAIKCVKMDIVEELGDDDEYYMEVISSLGSNHALELRLLRVRDEMIGSMPKSRDHFDPVYFLERIYGENNKVVVLDSNKLSPNWEDQINRNNKQSKYVWDKLSDEMRAHEGEPVEVEETDVDDVYEEPILDDNGPDHDGPEDDGPECPPEASRNLPKRVLAYTSTKLLKLFSKCKRGSVDGTFKSACKMWAQQFIFMVKYNKHWIPVVWGWLPDKSEVSYKVNHWNLFFSHDFLYFSIFFRFSST